MKEDTKEATEKKKIQHIQLFFEQMITELDNFFISNHKRNLYRFVISKVEKPLIENVLNKTMGNKRKTAQILGISRNTLYSKIKRLGIETNR